MCIRDRDIKVYSWKDLTTYLDTDSDINLNKNVKILVKDGQGLSEDGETFKMCIRDRDLAAAFAAMVLVDSNKEVVGATGDINTRPCLLYTSRCV